MTHAKHRYLRIVRLERHFASLWALGNNQRYHKELYLVKLNGLIHKAITHYHRAM